MLVARCRIAGNCRSSWWCCRGRAWTVALALLGPLADGLAGVDVVDTDGSRLGVNLLPLAGRAARQDRVAQSQLALGAVLIASLLAAMWLTLGNRQEALADLTERVDAAQGAGARSAQACATRSSGSVHAANFLARQRAKQPTILELLADLTRRMPDSTSLEKISVNDGNVVLIGQSQQASALVGLLQASTADPHADPDRLGADRSAHRQGTLHADRRGRRQQPRQGGRRWRPQSADRWRILGGVALALVAVYLVTVHWWFTAPMLSMGGETEALLDEEQALRVQIAQRPQLEARLAQVRAVRGGQPGLPAREQSRAGQRRPGATPAAGGRQRQSESQCLPDHRADADRHDARRIPIRE